MGYSSNALNKRHCKSRSYHSNRRVHHSLFGLLFAYPKTFSEGFLNIEQRATFAYIGAIFLLLAYGLYFSGCPWLIRGKRNVHQFVGDILSTNDYATVQKVLEESETYLKPIDVSLLPEKQEKLLHEIKH